MKGAQRRIETREQSLTDLRITLWFPPLGFRSKTNCSSPTAQLFLTQHAVSRAVDDPASTCRYISIGAKTSDLLEYNIKKELDRNALKCSGNIGIKILFL